MAGVNDLTTVAKARLWTNTSGSENKAVDQILGMLITSCSQQVLDYCERDAFVSQQYVDVYDGSGGRNQFLKIWPVTSIAQVVVDGIVIPASPMNIGSQDTVTTTSGGYGYRAEQWNGKLPGNPTSLEMIGGGRFRAGSQNVQVTYNAGYLVSGEAWTVPSGSSNQVIVNQSRGSWIADNGVTYANGTALVAVSSSPSIGQYALVPLTDLYGSPSPGTYQFSSGDAGQSVLISYSFVPSTIEQCVLDLILETYSRRSRPGVRSMSVQGAQTTTYNDDDMPKHIKTRLQPYRNVLPY